MRAAGLLLAAIVALAATRTSAQADVTAFITEPFGNVTVNATGVCGQNLTAIPVQTCDDLGLNELVTNSTNGTGFVTECAFNASIELLAPPVITCQDITVAIPETLGNVSINATDVVVSATDACGGPIAFFNLTQEDFFCSDVGSVSVNVTATDSYGNSADCAFQVTVEIDAPPLIECQDITVTLNASLTATANASDAVVSATDACGNATTITSTTLSTSEFTCADLGVSEINVTAVDTFGNSADCPLNVTVDLVAPPVITCQDITVAIPETLGNVSINATDVVVSATDACGGPIAFFNLTQEDFFCSDVGSVSVNVTATDSYGNAADCEFNVTVTIAAPPIVDCAEVTAALDEFGVAALNASEPIVSATDACGNPVTNFSLSQDTFFCSDIGTQLAVVTVTDTFGNTATCDFNVTIEDNLPATLLCPPSSVFQSRDGHVSTIVNFDTALQDNCPQDDVVCSTPSGSPFRDGTTTVECTAAEQTCSFNVKVLPAVACTQDRDCHRTLGNEFACKKCINGVELPTGRGVSGFCRADIDDVCLLADTFTLPPPASTTNVIIVPWNQPTPITEAMVAGGYLIQDDASTVVGVSLTASVGTLDLDLPPGSSISFTTGDGRGDIVAAFTGTVAHSNALIEPLTYTPPVGYVGEAQIVIVVDFGATGRRRRAEPSRSRRAPLTTTVISLFVVPDGTPCSSDTDCSATQQYCLVVPTIGGRCQPLPALGESCSTAIPCRSGLSCVVGRCFPAPRAPPPPPHYFPQPHPTAGRAQHTPPPVYRAATLSKKQKRKQRRKQAAKKRRLRKQAKKSANRG